MADKTIVSPMDPSQKNSPVTDPNEEESTVMLDSAANECVWNGQTFAEGDTVESDGAVFECNYGRWVKN
jgi:hypothetical protein